MFSAPLFPILPFLVIIASSIALTIPTENALQSLTQPLVDGNATSIPALLHPAQNLSVTAPPVVQCDGNLYKYDLVKSSCIDAIYTIPGDANVVTFGDRGLGVYDYPLPHRFISCEPIPDSPLAH